MSSTLEAPVLVGQGAVGQVTGPPALMQWFLTWPVFGVLPARKPRPRAEATLPRLPFPEWQSWGSQGLCSQILPLLGLPRDRTHAEVPFHSSASATLCAQCHISGG